MRLPARSQTDRAAQREANRQQADRFRDFVWTGIVEARFRLDRPIRDRFSRLGVEHFRNPGPRHGVAESDCQTGLDVLRGKNWFPRLA